MNMNTKRKILPLGDRVLVRVMEAEKKTKSGIIIPDTVSKERSDEGVIVAVGPGRTTEDGKVIPLNVKVGDVILFSKYGPNEIKIDEEDYYILSESNILAVIK